LFGVTQHLPLQQFHKTRAQKDSFS